MKRLKEILVTPVLALLVCVALGLLAGEPFFVSKLFGSAMHSYPKLGLLMVLVSIVGLGCIIEAIQFGRNANSKKLAEASNRN